MILGNEIYSDMTDEERQIIADANSYFSKMRSKRLAENREHNARQRKWRNAKLVYTAAACIDFFICSLSSWWMLIPGIACIILTVKILSHHKRHLLPTNFDTVTREMSEELGYERIDRECEPGMQGMMMQMQGMTGPSSWGMQGLSEVPGYTGVGYTKPFSGYLGCSPTYSPLNPAPTGSLLASYTTEFRPVWRGGY